MRKSVNGNINRFSKFFKKFLKLQDLQWPLPDPDEMTATLLCEKIVYRLTDDIQVNLSDHPLCK